MLTAHLAFVKTFWNSPRSLCEAGRKQCTPLCMASYLPPHVGLWDYYWASGSPMARVQREGRPEQGLLMMFVPGEKATRPSPGPCMLCVWWLSCESARTRVALGIVSADESGAVVGERPASRPWALLGSLGGWAVCLAGFIIRERILLEGTAPDILHSPGKRQHLQCLESGLVGRVLPWGF